ncbi:hypothetical protein [Paraburkholderia graminis]|uniref:hypothetical protein n=1 Tax=Paraburkholderia graminis TaxID=60548 RepID=UPI001379A891|nr:hypothetical protein [Paraburkholderia graminis]
MTTSKGAAMILRRVVAKLRIKRRRRSRLPDVTGHMRSTCVDTPPVLAVLRPQAWFATR